MEIYVNKKYDRDIIEIFAFEKTPKGRMFISPTDGAKGFKRTEIGWDEIPNEDVVEPLIKLPMYLGLPIIELIAEWAKNEGINVKEQSNLAGKATAIEKHNEFLQTNLAKLLDHLTRAPIVFGGYTETIVDSCNKIVK